MADRMVAPSLRAIGILLALAWGAIPVPAGAQPFDHLECYATKDLRPRSYREHTLTASPRLDPPFVAQTGCRVKTRARRMCVDVAKSAVEPPPPGAPPGTSAGQLYLCYAMRCDRTADVAVELVDQLAAGTVVARGRASRELCVPAAGPATTTTTTTSSTTTTTATLPACVGSVVVDPGDTVPALPVGVATGIPVSATVVSGIFDVFMDDGGVGGTIVCPPGGCVMGVGASGDVVFTYTAPAGAPATITLTAVLSPHSPGFTCGPGSAGGMSSKAYAVVP